MHAWFLVRIVQLLISNNSLTKEKLNIQLLEIIVFLIFSN